MRSDDTRQAVAASPRGRYAKGLAKRAEILQVALTAYAQADESAPTLRSIAEAVRLTEAGVLHYFGSKDELLIAILEARDEAAGTTYDLTSREGIFDYLADVIRTPGLVRLFVEMTAASSQPGHPAGTFMTAHGEAVRQIVTSLLGRDDESAARILLAAAEGLQIQWLRDPSLDVLTDLRRVFDLVVADNTA
jgi:AcrR family transcriptional regulator